MAQTVFMERFIRIRDVEALIYESACESSACLGSAFIGE